jgi:hypothetical protein
VTAETQSIYVWRRVDWPGLEVLRLTRGPEGHQVRSEVVDGGEAPFALRYEANFSPDWRSRWLRARLTPRTGPERGLLVEREGELGWRVDGAARPELEGCEELDLALSPFSNMLALRLLALEPGGSRELLTTYVAFPELTVQPSRQRYERLGPRLFRYVDLGAAAGFEARITVDEDDMVRLYEGLFERIEDK